MMAEMESQSEFANVNEYAVEDGGSTPQPAYVLMTKKQRVSRSYRAKWLITNLVEFTSPTEDMDDDMYMIPTPKSPPNLINSNVFFMSHRYSLVFILDMSTTMLQVSNETFAIKLDEGVKALVTLLEQLINPMTISSFPNDNNKFSPQLFISVLVYSGSIDPQKRVTVLIQGAHLNTDNVTDIIDIVKKGILKLENKRASTDKEQRRECSNADTSTRADNCLEKMIKAGHLGVQLLPQGAIKGIVVITDGIGGFTTPSSMHSTVNQLRTANIGCWVVLCGGGSSPSLSLGSVPDTQAVGFLTEACNGSVIDPAKLMQIAATIDDQSLIGINPCQKCILFWSVQVSSWMERRDCLSSSGFCEHQIDPFVPQRIYTQNRTTVTSPLTTLIGCRAREGFLVESALIKDSILEIVLTYPWQSNIIIHYSIRTTWPVTMTTSCSLLTTVSFVAPYPFVRDFQSDIRHFSGPHATSLKRFKQTLKSLTHSDTFLSHSIAFSTNSQFYTLPSSLDKAMPLFHTSNSSQSKPVPAQPSGDSKSLPILCKYWTPLASLDINIWTKWMHTEKIILVLSQDSALPPHLLHPSSSGRYSTLQCRVAALKLFTYLRSWCSLMLLENQLFLKFLPDDGTPCYFCVVRVSQMQPCILVHVGFIEGIPHSLQIDTVTKLRSSIEKLVISLPLKESQVPLMKRKKSRLPQQPCTTIIKKQLQKMLISYDLPRETTSEVPVQLEYLDRFGWQWDVPHRNPDILIGLLQQRLREGFLIASSSNGIATLVAQIEVKQPSSALSFPSLIQYVIFPFNQITGKFFTEVWVEPQYQYISNTPPGLEYLRDEEINNIPYKIHSKDMSVVTQITTFLEYSPKSSSFTPPSSSSSVGGPEATPLSIKFNQEIHSDLSSLYSRSHVTTLAFSAFTEAYVTSTGPITLGDCSLLNVQLNRKLLSLLNERLTAKTVHVKEPVKLMQRLKDSDELKPFFKLYLETASHPLWKCFIIDDPNGLMLIFTPCFVCCSPSETPAINQTTPTDKQATPITNSPNVLSLPIVLMYTTLPHLLGEDTVLSGLQPLPPDKHFDCLFDSQKNSKKFSSGFNSTLLEKVKHIHMLAYLSALQDGLTVTGKDLLSLSDLEKGLTISSKATLSTDLTPLLMGVCHNCGLTDGTAITLENLASLLETLDQQNHDYSVQFTTESSVGSHSYCLQREKDVNNLFREFLEEIGFFSVNQSGYYWYREDQQHSRETSAMNDEGGQEGDDKTDTSLGTPPLVATRDLSMATEDEDSDFELSNLEPIFTPPSKSTSTRVVHIDHAPLFIRLRTVLSSVTDTTLEEQEKIENKLAEQGHISLCSETLFSGTSVKLSDNQCWKLSLAIEVFSLLETRDLTEDKRSHSDSSMSSIHSCFRPVVSLLKSKAEWLVKDELVSRARELFDNDEMVPSSLLPSVTSHIQGSFKRSNNCLMEHIPVRFVLGQTSSSPQFMQFLSSIELPNAKIHQAENNYFYFTSTPGSSSVQYSTPPKGEKGRNKARSSTPTILMKPPSRQNLLQSHRRTRSLTSDLSSISTTSQALSIPGTSYTTRKSISSVESPLEGTPECPLEEVTDSMYDASKSNSVTSVVTNLSTSISCCSIEEKFWVVLRVVTNQVEVYLHSRCSLGLSDENRNRQLQQCSSIIKAVQAICHKTNQWYLLKDLLDTHLCSSLLLAESSSAAWVEGTTNAVKEITFDGETFTSCEFQCKLQWREHITPHWRLKNMGNKIALKITSSALSAFGVSNRQNVYVLQDVMDDGEEAVFYLIVSESVCIEDSNFNNEAPPIFDDPQRCETRATVDDDSISNFSYQRSSFDIAETPSQLSRQVSTSLFSLTSGTRESVVLELYGITAPSDSMTTRLQRLIKSKLDDKALEMMCSMYTRNQKLELSNADVLFLQEYPEKPSEVFSIPIPEWVSYPQALFYYMLQQFSILFTKPQYNTVDGPYSVLCVPPAVDKVLRENNLNTSIQHDLLSLYIRPFTKGRGMALISACLVSPEGVVLPPILDILPPTILPVVPSYDDIRNIYTIEQFPVISDQHTIALHIWERGNVGMNELRNKLISAVQCALVDVLMEIHFLQLPIATLSDADINGLISPGLLRRTRYSTSRSNSENLSFVDVTFTSSKESMESAQRDIEEPVKGLVVMDTGSPDWEQREKQRRQQYCREVLKRDALMGKRGVMKKEYLEIFTTFLTNANDIGLPEVFYQSWRVPTNYVVNAILSQALSILSSSLASLSATCEMTFSIWKMESDSPNFKFISRADFESSKESQQPCGYHSNNSFVLVGRDLSQWREAMDPHDCTLKQEQYWPTEQHFLPLSSWKKYDDNGILLNATARKHNTFIPRQRMVLAYLVDGMFHLWLYNVIEDRVKEIKARITNLENWQFKRSGLLYHILSQKMGLFHHTGSRDIAPLTQRAVKYCSNIQGISTLVNNANPMPTSKPSSSRQSFELDNFYQDLEPSVTLAHTHSDPVKRHGHQFYETFSSHRETVKHLDLLLKVFNTWDSDRRSKTDQATPISSEVISKLKQTSRLLHYCSSSVWLLSKSYVSNLPETVSEQTILEDASSWFNCIREKFLSEYVAYLQTLHFQSINERPPSRPKGQLSPQHSAAKFHKCLQRSWPGGIILIELSFQTQLFLVKLYSLELSRSSNLPPPSYDVSGLFSQECSRIKDYIHTHSFNYDFHVRNIHSIVQGRLKVEGELDLRNLLNEFCNNYVNPPFYIRNRVCSDYFKIKVSVHSKALYTYIIGHCSDYSVQRIDVIQASGNGCGSSIAWDNCLMIDLRSSITGGITAPELSCVLKETKDMYNVIVLAMPDVNEGAGPVATELPLMIYMLLVNKLEMYPRLTSNSPLISHTSRKAPIVMTSEGEIISAVGRGDSSTSLGLEKLSELQDSVMYHRRKLGYGSLASPSSTSEMVFNPHVLNELMFRLKVHFENIIKSAQSHVRRDELWKRLLYGGLSPDIPMLSHTEFMELLMLVRYEELEQFDVVLASLKHQTKKWYQNLIDFLNLKFIDNIKIFRETPSDTTHAIIVNQDWHDMLIMVVCGSQSQGFYTVYRKSHEAGTSFEERKLTANIEAEQLHINEFVNYVCSFVWVDIMNSTPSMSPKLKR